MSQYSQHFYYNGWQMIRKEGAMFVYATSKGNSFRYDHNGCNYNFAKQVDFVQEAIAQWEQQLHILHGHIQEVIKDATHQEAIMRRYKKLQREEVFEQVIHGLQKKIDHLGDESIERLVQILKIYHEQYIAVLGENHITYETINDAFGFLKMYPAILEEFILNLYHMETSTSTVKCEEGMEIDENIKIKIKSSYSGLSDYAQPSLFVA